MKGERALGTGRGARAPARAPLRARDGDPSARRRSSRRGGGPTRSRRRRRRDRGRHDLRDRPGRRGGRPRVARFALARGVAGRARDGGARASGALPAQRERQRGGGASRASPASSIRSMARAALCTTSARPGCWLASPPSRSEASPRRLCDVEVAAMTELPPSKQRLADQLSGVRGAGSRGVRGLRVDLDSRRAHAFRPRPSRATDLLHGFAALARFFPPEKELVSRIEAARARRALRPARGLAGSATRLRRPVPRHGRPVLRAARRTRSLARATSVRSSTATWASRQRPPATPTTPARASCSRSWAACSRSREAAASTRRSTS